MPLRARAAAKTDIGLVRRANQDSFGVVDELALYVVCDGMGGSAGGDIASDIAVKTFVATARQELEAVGNNEERDQQALWRAALAANRAVRLRAAADPHLRGMGTTLVGARIVGDSLTLVNVGDSRAYLVRNGQVRQLTEDHSFVAESVRRGVMTPEQAERSMMQSVITRAIGAEDDVQADIFHERLEDGDTILLTSDGLTRHVEDEEIAEVLSRPEQSVMESCRLLIEMAKNDGGSDNITCLVVRMREELSVGSGGMMFPA